MPVMANDSSYKAEQGQRKQNTGATDDAAKGKTVHHVNPLGMRVLVRIRKTRHMTEGGLYLPEGAKEAMDESVVAEVVEVASAIDDQSHEETNVSGIPLGAAVLISRKAGVRVPWDEELRIVETKDVLAMVETVSVS
jgi:co-chaperonin GroES (HSP10)